MKPSRDWIGIVLVLLGASSYGLVSSSVKSAMDEGWGAPQITLVQTICGTALLWLTTAGIRRRIGANRASWTTWLKLAGIGAVGLALTTIFYNESLSRLNASLAIVLLFQFTWITILLESVRLRQWPARAEWIATCFVLVGTVLAVGVLEQDVGSLSAAGIGYGLLAAVSYSLFLWLTGLLPGDVHPMLKSAAMTTASLVLVVLLFPPANYEWGGSLSLWGWGILLGFLTALSAVCFNVGIPRIGSSLAALLGSMELPVAIVAAYLWLGEPLSGWQGVGIALILVGIVAAERKAGQPASAGSEAEE